MNVQSRYRTIAGVSVPDTPITHSALTFALTHCDPYLFNHAVRSWLFAVRVAQIEGITHDEEIVALGTLLHDVTLNDRFAGPRRFEVEAADIAKRFAIEMEMGNERAQRVWDIVALNSTPSIALYKETEVSLCTAAIGLDVIGYRFGVIPAEEMSAILQEYPRLNLKKQLTKCFCHIAETAPETTFDNFVRDYGRRFVVGYRATSVVDLVCDAPFEE
ncbi:hypothetical protein [Rhizobium sp. GCM10022189]|uniref:hypothetical protein n=1 Tax=Rhizobium sp. GCM10022189 TaxID=3252654 RepID=UPI00361CCC8D